jgi:hypothetical protein
MRPEMPNAERIVDPSLLLDLGLRSDKPRKVPLQVFSQLLNIRMYIDDPVLIYVVDIRYMDLLATETGDNLGAMVLLFHYLRLRGWGFVMGVGAFACLNGLRELVYSRSVKT